MPSKNVYWSFYFAVVGEFLSHLYTPLDVDNSPWITFYHLPILPPNPSCKSPHLPIKDPPSLFKNLSRSSRPPTPLFSLPSTIPPNNLSLFRSPTHYHIYSRERLPLCYFFPPFFKFLLFSPFCHSPPTPQRRTPDFPYVI